MIAVSRESRTALQRESVIEAISGCGVTRKVAVFDTPPRDAVMTTERADVTGSVVTATEVDFP
jgi:hypothetical protein